MEDYRLLDQADEDALHKSRLLNVEEKPFKRITRRLLDQKSLVLNPVAHLPTPPPDGADADTAAQYEADKQKALEQYRQFREDVILDFAAFESSIARIQFLLSSNEKERERYAAEKDRILQTAQEVRDNSAELRVQLEEAQKTLSLRKTYDELADKITSNRLLRPREDQLANLEKLNAEIAKLEMESMEYAKTWAERREQFGRIVEEGMNLRRLIRDEKEEVERREGMEEGGEGDEGDTASKGRESVAGTPRPDQDTSMTPSQPATDDAVSVSGRGPVEKQRSDLTRAGTPLRQSMTASEVPEEKPVIQEMEVDEGEVSADESPARDTTAAGTRAGSVDEMEEGEERSDEKPEDKMDTT
ncbi:hypothetical protein VTO42DRAFT_2290 [Malbranchea cinnamomea]